MVRNRCRPSWHQLNSNSPSLVSSASSACFSHLLLSRAVVVSGDVVVAAARQDKEQQQHSSWRQALLSISELYGVGPATGSIALSMLDARSPFYSEEAIRVAGVQNFGNYSFANYEEFRDKMNDKAERINEMEEGERGKLTQVTPVMMERAIWSVVYATKYKEEFLEFQEGGGKKTVSSSSTTKSTTKSKTETTASTTTVKRVESTALERIEHEDERPKKRSRTNGK